ncbi:MAG TPA: type II toxin-antitoxin system RelE/ParE family toxin [Tepidisphaeraceae bacterium]|jgi:toxin ParE1/3/4|nr:type II toxin-antitoxin system RelE/ParE family toxin [Tepidisphaeraceae bacterium]
MKSRISLPADADINGIWNYIGQDNPSAANRVEQSIHAAIEKLEEHPNFGHPRDDIAPAEYKFYRVHSYFIVYRIEGDTLVVVRVIHAARNLPKFF